jgi:alpha-galactosidase
MRSRLLAGTSLLVGLLVADVASGATIVAKAGDASISHDAVEGTWAIATGGATLTLNLDSTKDFSIVGLVTTSNRAWSLGGVSDTTVTIDGRPLAFGSRAAGFSYDGVTPSASGSTLHLDAAFLLIDAGLRITRHYVVTSGSPTFEAWTTYAPLGGAHATLSNLSALALIVPNGAVRWLMGLQGDNANTVHDSAFTLQQKTLAIGEHLAMGAQGRASEQIVPWFAVDGSPDEFYAALMWSGAWSLSLDRSDSGLSLAVTLGSMSTVVENVPLDGPHVLFGVVRGGLPQASAAIRSYGLQALRGGRALTPMVTYNTWFAYGTEIDDASMRQEMTRAAAIGTELFVIDAGWYAGAGAASPFDFDAGLGSWSPDPVRFPNGLKPLGDYAHSLGMKFGIWVEPERVNLSTVGDPGVAEEWLATAGGRYGSDHAAQICLASDAARAWLMDRITTFLDAVQPDYLKWDNNMWINCDRPGHGHGPSDGNFAHVHGLYDVMASLRQQYPNLLIENVSGGGNRLDFGMYRYTDVAWMDDRTAPSVHVRHNVEGLSAVFPPAYLLSFLISHDGEPLNDAPDLALYTRSRMAAALGLCFKSAELSANDLANVKAEIAIYKSIRPTLGGAASILLTAQAKATKGPAWDVLQETGAGGKQVMIYAFQSDPAVAKINVKPSGLAAQTMYEVRSVDSGVLGVMKGADLSAQGIDILQSPKSAAHLLVLTAK